MIYMMVCKPLKQCCAAQETLFILKNAKLFGTQAGDVFQVSVDSSLRKPSRLLHALDRLPAGLLSLKV